ncbi:ABC transporter ATP-binding protein [Arthrobacter pityocampae]|uniref:ABC transporter ATP-binding protein n=1 Tax=Arthrobacter pityocampae TaxID=547334 RepID=A0A2S5IZV4_9MICC|nr:ABC transporter ATP-binding protein [Arthrobacter pityocampae]PPB50126.1 ABC transporter ATP-binding protein [Arthrobacter pityocampae]
MSAVPVIDARNICKSYGKGDGRFDALRDVTLRIERGECVAIVGKSGSGKSTLMHIIAMLDTPDAGSLAYAGEDALALSPKSVSELRNQEFGFVFQQFFLTPGTSVLDNVTLPLKITGEPSKSRKARGLEVLRQLELEDKATSRATDLSGGQKQRVVISRALVNEPSVIFADEPTGNLDSATGAIVQDTLFALNRDLGITLVIVTHDEELAARCDRQVFLRDGVLVAPAQDRGAAA